MNSWRSTMLWKFAWRQMRRRPGRTMLTLVGVVLGVATIVAVSLATRATRSTYQEMFAEVTGRANFEVVAEGLGGFDEKLASRLRQVPGVKEAVPVIQLTVALIGKAGPTPVLVLGIDPARDRAVRDYLVRQGRMLDPHQSADGLLLETSFADAIGCAIGSMVKLWTTAGMCELPVIGLLEARGVTSFNGGAVAVMSLTTAQKAFKLAQQITSVQCIVDDSADLAALRAQLPTGLILQAPEARGQRAQSALYAVNQSLVGMSFAMLVAGAFVILNTFLMNVTERRRQLAILRAIGFTRRQTTGLLLREAIILGLAGTMLGIGAGYGLSLMTLHGMQQVLGGVKTRGITWSVEPLALAFAFGPGMALAATWLPARRAARRAPLEDLLARGGVFEEHPRRVPQFVGLTLICLFLFLLAALGAGWLDPAYLAMLQPVGILGGVLVIPMLIAPLLPAVAFLLSRLLGFEGRLATLQLSRRPARTGLTVGILAMAIFVCIGVGQTLLASVQDIRDWCAKVAAADFYVRGTLPDGGYAITMSQLPEGLEADLGRLEGVDRVDKVNWILARAQGEQVVVLACSFPPGHPTMDLRAGTTNEVSQALARGDVVLGTGLARKLKLKVGDSIMLDTRLGPTPRRIAGTANEYTIDGMALYMEWETARRLFKTEGVHVFAISARPEMAGPLAERLGRFADERHLMVQSRKDLHGYIDGVVSQYAGMMWTLLTLVFIVAAMGVVNTLTMNVLEQTRELGVLRAVGLRRRQLRKLVFSQALAIGLVSLLPGTLLGLMFAYLISLVARALLAHALDFRIDSILVAMCLAGAMIVSIVAAALPARRAARLRIVEALQYE